MKRKASKYAPELFLLAFYFIIILAIVIKKGHW